MINTIPYPGNKRLCVDRLLGHLGGAETIASPFVGMGAVELAGLERGLYKRAILGDASPAVVAILRGARRAPERMHRLQIKVRRHIGGDPGRLKDIQARAEAAIKADDRPEEIGALLLGASCWSFSRLFCRVNSSGGLNVSHDPRGRPPISESTLLRYHRLLQRAEIRLASWEWIKGLGWMPIYIDPPYLGRGGFTTYTAEGWRDGDARELAAALGELRSCRVVVSEQDPGGAHIYRAGIGAAREYVEHSHERVRNARGDQQSEIRQEVTIVAPAEGRMR